MAITLTTSNKVSNGSATTTLALPAFSSTAGQRVIVGVAILDTTKSVSTITDTAGSSFYQLIRAENNGTAIRSEIWFLDSVNANASNVITITFSGATLASAVFGEYAGSTGFGSTGSTHGTNANPSVNSLMIGSSDWIIGTLAIASSSGDTVSANLGTIRQTSIPALTSAGIVLMDNTSLITGSLSCSGVISTSRAWSMTAIDIKSGLPATTVTAANVAIATQADAGAKHQTVKAPINNAGAGSSTANTGFVG